MEVQGFEGHGPEIEHLLRSARAGRLVHAYLFCGARGCGKTTLARLLAQALFCGAGEAERPCGHCPACKRFLSGNHPDARTVAPKGRSIGVDDVRELIDYLSRRPYEGGWHVAILERAEKMTPSAQNALLKTLENPPEDTVFFLLTETPGALLSTVRSRARLVRVSPLTREACAEALVRRGVEAKRAARLAGLAHGSVGRALELGSDAGFEALLARSLTSLAALKDPASVAEAAAPFYEERERQEDLLEIFEIIGRDRMALENGVAPEALTGEELENVRVDGRKLLLSVLAARRMLSANVAWPNALDALYLSLV
ncbi:MAG TPA: DNA polymerase III subunit delta' [Candidatus Pullichristensenella stercoripullorum]|nr:DNA polymerase III subunit delta' [Candidatus Pullichristensenella stercoripullorum]